MNDGDDEPPVVNFLGDLTDELDGKHIVEFVYVGPKNYAYCTNDGDTCCKVKGFTLNHENAKKINFNTMCSEVFLWHFHGATMHTRLDNPRQICHNPKKQTIFNRLEHKSYTVVYDKRRVLYNLDTLPYGYKEH